MNPITNEEMADTLNGLVKINNDRMTGYQQVATEIDDTSLRVVFENMVNESVNFAENLGAYVRDFGGTPVTGGTLAGTIHQGWINVKDALVGNNREAMLESCEFGDKAAIEAYETALATDAITQNSELKTVLNGQKSSITQSLQVIKSISRSKTATNTQAERQTLGNTY